MKRALFLSLLTVCSAAIADDWTQWAGNDRLGNWAEDGILDTFPEDGLKPVWSVPCGSGYSGPVVSDGRVIITDYRPKDGTTTLEAVERVLCLDEATGREVWSYEYDTHYRRQMQSYATGPRGTPVVHEGRVYTVGATGQICCLNATDGKLVWSLDALEVLGGSVPVFGVSCSPLVWKQSLICTCGGRDGILRALDLETGKELWKALPGAFDMPYSAPEILMLPGGPQLVQWHKEGLAGFHPDTGESLWSVPFSVRSNMAIARPLLVDDQILVSGFYDGSMLVRVSGNSAEVVWKNGGSGEKPNQTKSLHAVITTPIVDQGHFYGTCSYGELRGLSLADGERLWERKDLTRQGRWGSMFWVRHQDRYFVNNDLGELLIMKFTPEGPQVIDRTQLITPDTQCG